MKLYAIDPEEELDSDIAGNEEQVLLDDDSLDTDESELDDDDD
ncbi:hypothetical protein [Pedobacter sp. SYSU D00535]|nr:hypothetical protein [Pedobacter sp. SYSU D00535]